MQRLFTTASSIILTNITIGALDHLDSLEVHYSLCPSSLWSFCHSTFDFLLYLRTWLSVFLLSSLQLLPFRIPDLSCGSPLVVSGRYTGNFPDSVKINGSLADMRNFTIELKTQRAKDVQLDKVMFILGIVLYMYSTIANLYRIGL